jgi:hypothetical protein
MVETKGGQTLYSITDESRTISLPIRWSFGKGAQTWVLEKQGELYESMVSYYPSIDGLEITTGDEELKPQNLDEAVGRKLRVSDAKDCFGCHSTAAVSMGKLHLDTIQPGVSCVSGRGVRDESPGFEKALVRRHLELLRTMPSHLGDGCAKPVAR